MTDLIAMAPRKAARIAGALYLFIIAGGLFAELFVRERLVAPGDAATTARNILEHELLYRTGFAVHLSYLACAVAVAVILYRLLARVDGSLALLALCFNVVAIAVEASGLLNLLAPMRLLADSGVSMIGAGQAQALSYAFVQQFASAFGISLVFFGGFCLAIGTLVYRSGVLPRLIGLLMLLAGTCYLVNSFAVFVLPDLGAWLFPYILLPCLVAELSLALWLLAKGIDPDGRPAA